MPGVWRAVVSGAVRYLLTDRVPGVDYLFLPLVVSKSSMNLKQNVAGYYSLSPDLGGTIRFNRELGKAPALRCTSCVFAPVLVSVLRWHFVGFVAVAAFCCLVLVRQCSFYFQCTALLPTIPVHPDKTEMAAISAEVHGLTRCPLAQPLYQAPPVACFPVNTALSRQLPLDGSPRGDGLPREHTGKGMDDSTVRSPNREGGDHRASFSSGTDSADPGTEGVWRSAPAPNTDQLSAFRGGGGGGSGSRINGGTGDLQQDQSEGKMSMLEVLSHSAATAVETSGEKG